MCWATGRYCFDSQQGKEMFSVLQNIPTQSGAKPPPYLMGTGCYVPRGKKRGVKLIHHLGLLKRLRMSVVPKNKCTFMLQLSFCRVIQGVVFVEHLHTRTKMKCLNFVNKELKATQNTRYLI